MKKSIKILLIISLLIGSLFFLTACGMTEEERQQRQEERERDRYEQRQEDFKYRIRRVLQHHYDVENNNIDEAQARGAWAAFGLNLRLYDGFKHYAYYYAMHGEQAYINRFGRNNYFEEVKEFVNSIRESM